MALARLEGAQNLALEECDVCDHDSLVSLYEYELYGISLPTPSEYAKESAAGIMLRTVNPFTTSRNSSTLVPSSLSPKRGCISEGVTLCLHSCVSGVVVESGGDPRQQPVRKIFVSVAGRARTAHAS